MPRGKVSRGECQFCHQAIAKSGVKRHLASCQPYQAAIAAAEDSRRASETLYHLRAQDAYSKSFWLDFEIPGSTKLKEIDTYLRAIWLECCGHLSQFDLGRSFSQTIGLSRPVEAVFSSDMTITHTYDFGDTSETQLQTIARRQGTPLTKHPIALLLRNLPPEASCSQCDRPATHLCLECIYEEQTDGLLCDRHVEHHPHEDYGEPIPLVNSPRVGLCAYCGPAEPPY